MAQAQKEQEIYRPQTQVSTAKDHCYHKVLGAASSFDKALDKALGKMRHQLSQERAELDRAVEMLAVACGIKPRAMDTQQAQVALLRKMATEAPMPWHRVGRRATLAYLRQESPATGLVVYDTDGNTILPKRSLMDCGADVSCIGHTLAMQTGRLIERCKLRVKAFGELNVPVIGRIRDFPITFAAGTPHEVTVVITWVYVFADSETYDLLVAQNIMQHHCLNLWPCAHMEAVIMFPTLHLADKAAVERSTEVDRHHMLGAMVLLPATMLSEEDSSHALMARHQTEDDELCTLAHLPRVCMLEGTHADEDAGHQPRPFHPVGAEAATLWRHTRGVIEDLLGTTHTYTPMDMEATLLASLATTTHADNVLPRQRESIQHAALSELRAGVASMDPEDLDFRLRVTQAQLQAHSRLRTKPLDQALRELDAPWSSGATAGASAAVRANQRSVARAKLQQAHAALAQAADAHEVVGVNAFAMGSGALSACDAQHVFVLETGEFIPPAARLPTKLVGGALYYACVHPEILELLQDSYTAALRWYKALSTDDQRRHMAIVRPSKDVLDGWEFHPMLGWARALRLPSDGNSMRTRMTQSRDRMERAVYNVYSEECQSQQLRVIIAWSKRHSCVADLPRDSWAQFSLEASPVHSRHALAREQFRMKRELGETLPGLPLEFMLWGYQGMPEPMLLPEHLDLTEEAKARIGPQCAMLEELYTAGLDLARLGGREYAELWCYGDTPIGMPHTRGASVYALAIDRGIRTLASTDADAASSVWENYDQLRCSPQMAVQLRIAAIASYVWGGAPYTRLPLPHPADFTPCDPRSTDAWYTQHWALHPYATSGGMGRDIGPQLPGYPLPDF